MHWGWTAKVSGCYCKVGQLVGDVLLKEVRANNSLILYTQSGFMRRQGMLTIQTERRWTHDRYNSRDGNRQIQSDNQGLRAQARRCASGIPT